MAPATLLLQTYWHHPFRGMPCRTAKRKPKKLSVCNDEQANHAFDWSYIGTVHSRGPASSLPIHMQLSMTCEAHDACQNRQQTNICMRSCLCYLCAQAMAPRPPLPTMHLLQPRTSKLQCSQRLTLTAASHKMSDKRSPLQHNFAKAHMAFAPLYVSVPSCHCLSQNWAEGQHIKIVLSLSSPAQMLLCPSCLPACTTHLARSHWAASVSPRHLLHGSMHQAAMQNIFSAAMSSLLLPCCLHKVQNCSAVKCGARCAGTGSSAASRLTGWLHGPGMAGHDR